MKLFNFAAILAVAGIAQVLAVPLLVVPKSPSPDLQHFRLGHAVKNQVEIEGGKMKRGPCRASRFKQKAVEISNVFREALGLPLIQPGHPNNGNIRILPFIGTPVTFVPVHGKEVEGGVKFYVSDIPDEHPHPPHHHPHGHHHHHHHHGPHGPGKGSFISRVHHSLMNLGRWEGRAVAFVLGCGIGVLLRMVFVLAVIMYRAVKGQRGEEQQEYSQIIIETIVDTPKSAPPSYTYIVDEKVPFAVETVKAPSTTEEYK